MFIDFQARNVPKSMATRSYIDGGWEHSLDPLPRFGEKVPRKEAGKGKDKQRVVETGGKEGWGELAPPNGSKGL